MVATNTTAPVAPSTLDGKHAVSNMILMLTHQIAATALYRNVTTNAAVLSRATNRNSAVTTEYASKHFDIAIDMTTAVMDQTSATALVSKFTTRREPTGGTTTAESCVMASPIVMMEVMSLTKCAIHPGRHLTSRRHRRHHLGL
jgi:hypothetical protein